MGGAAEKWRPGRGRRPGWGAQAGGVDGGAGGGQGPGGSGGPGGGGRAAAAPSAPPGASGLGLRLRGPDASRSSLRLCCNSSWRCCRRRCCSCCHGPRPGPGRRQLRTRPWPLLHPRGGVARHRRARRAGGQLGHSSLAREGRWRPARRQNPAAAAAADSALTLMLHGAPAPGGRLAPHPLPVPSGLLAWETPAPTSRLYVVAPSLLLSPARHKSGERLAGSAPPTPRATLPGGQPPPGASPAGTRWPCAPPPGCAGENRLVGSLLAVDASTLTDFFLFFFFFFAYSVS